MNELTIYQPSNDIMSRLRFSIQSLHRNVERNPFIQAILAQNLPIRLYVEQLAAYLCVYRSLENACNKHLNQTIVSHVWQPSMAKLPSIQADLDCFSVEMPSALVQAATVAFVNYIEAIANHPYQLLGALYVLEGSTLGMRKLLPHLQSTFSLDYQGLSFYASYGELTPIRWEGFKHRMNLTITDEIGQEYCIAAAQKTFHLTDNLLLSLWHSQ
jgi:heme oxygenase